MTPLDIFPAAPRWVAWRNENRGRRLTKVPYGRNGHGAKPTIQPPGSPKTRQPRSSSASAMVTAAASDTSSATSEATRTFAG